MIDFSQSPFLVIWETTQACDLACQHCRASAQREALPGELSTPEGKKLLEDIRDMGCKIVVLSGGDPLKRSDLFELIRYGKSLGMRMATIPAATDLLQRETIEGLKSAGLDQVAFSLDFPTSDLHDSFRGVSGAFDRTLEAVRWAREVSIPVQINTTITARSLPYLGAMAELVSNLGIVFWEVFFLVPTGRASSLESLTSLQCEAAFEILYKIHERCSFVLKVTEAPHYRRFVMQKKGNHRDLPSLLRRSEGPGGTVGLAPQAVNSGKGFLFVSYKGDIYPSGFLPLSAGNVRNCSIASVYRSAPLFCDLRDFRKLKGICGRCEFAGICGGSRSRAYALCDDPFASEPWCAYIPAAA